MFIRFGKIHERDRHTHRQTHRHRIRHRPCLRSIARQKYVCIRIGACNNTECARLSLAQGGLLQWVSQSRYLGIYVYIY